MNVCTNIHEFLARREAGLLTEAELALLEEHLEKCAACAGLARSVRGMLDGLETIGRVELKPSPAVRDRILAALPGRTARTGPISLRDRRSRHVAPIPMFSYLTRAAAVIIVVVGGYIFLKPQDATRAPDLAQVISRAAAAETVADLRAMHNDVRAVYLAERARKKDHNPVALMTLGTSSGITGNPKDDRQAEDLRFALDLAQKAKDAERPAAAFRFDLMPAAEAGAPELTLEEKNVIWKSYAAARDAAEHRYYDRWWEKLGDIAQLISRTDRKDITGPIADAHAFELICLTFYERGRARSAKLYMDAYMETSDYPCARYIRSHLKPIIDRAAAKAAALEANLDFRNIKRYGNGPVEVGTGPGAYQGNAWRVVSRNEPGVKDAGVFFPKPKFREAVLTCLTKITNYDEKAPDNETVWGAGVAFLMKQDVKYSVIGCNAKSVKTWDLKNLWLWSRVHMKYAGDGRWDLSIHNWVEGEQPRNIRSLKTEGLQAQTGSDRKANRAMSYWTTSSEGRPERAMLTLHADAALDWRMIGLEVLKE